MGYLFFILVTGHVAMIGLSQLSMGKEFLSFVQDGKTSSIYSTGLRKNAEAGLVSDQVKLAGWYVEGRGVGINTRQAVKWYRTAAEMGNVSAQRHLGSCYENGVGVAKCPRWENSSTPAVQGPLSIASTKAAGLPH